MFRFSAYVVLICAFILTALMLAGCKGQAPAAVSESGSCGENVSFVYEKASKTLTISGNGDMETSQFFFSDYPINNLIIEEGVTSISSDSFYGNQDLTGKLMLPGTLKKIGDFAFYGCSGITGELVIPDNVEVIGPYAFDMCYGLTGLSLPASLKVIGEEAFNRNNNMTGELRLPEGLTEIGRCAFSECAFTGPLIIPDTVKSIGSYAFSGCRGFDGELKLSSALTEIEQATFVNCEGFRGSLDIPDGITEIGEQAFAGCSGFDGELRLPEGLRNIGYYAFSGCKGFKGKLSMPDSAEKIGFDAFSGCAGFDGLKLPDGFRYIEKETFTGCSRMKGELRLPDCLKVIGSNAFSSCGFTGELRLPEGLLSLETGCFSNCKGLTGNLVIPDSVLCIKEMAFYECPGFTGELLIPSSVKSIGSYGFSGCSGLEKAVFSEGTDSIGHAAFSACSLLDEAEFTGITPDYYKAYESSPSFPEGCTLREAVPGSDRFTERLKADEVYLKTGEVTDPYDKGSMISGASEIRPYYWTESLSGEVFTGLGAYADTVLEFSGETLSVRVNERDFAELPYQADRDSEEHILYTDGFFCRDGEIKNMEYDESDRHAPFIKADIRYADGSSGKAYFHTGSEEVMYMLLESESADAVETVPETAEDPRTKRQALSDEGLTLLVNTCRKTLATVGGDGYSEIVLYQDDRTGEYWLHTYSKYVYMDEEDHASYAAAPELAESVMDYIREHDLASWKDHRGFAMTGGDFIIRFKQWIRLDSGNMTDQKAYYDINSILLSAAVEENRRYADQ